MAEVWDYEPTCGENVTRIAMELCVVATKDGRECRARFNGIVLVAQPGQGPDSVVAFYLAESKRREERHRLLLKGALMAAPEHMTLIDPEGWQKTVEANSDPYGKAAVDYAHLWARLMEGRIANGDTVAGCAEEASHLANVDGITCFMYGCAVSILSKVWKHGEELRRWHNLDAQVKDEGERAKMATKGHEEDTRKEG